MIGGGGHAKVLISVLRKLRYDLVGYTDLTSKGALLGVRYLGDDGVISHLVHDLGIRAAIGVGKTDASPTRMRLLADMARLGLETPVIISPQSVVNEAVTLGLGTVVLDGAVINSGAVTGRLCIINSNSTVEHDCQLGDNVHVAPGATISGSVAIGANCMIGAGSTVVHGVSICPDCLIGAGSTVLRDITAPGTYAGSPARRIG